MRRTAIYLEDRQLDLLRRLARDHGTSVAALVREAIDAWLKGQGARPASEDEWSRRFARLLERRRRVAAAGGFEPDEVERDVLQVVREARAR